MSDEIRLPRKVMKKFVKYCYKYVLSRIQETEKDSEYYTDATYLKNINALVKEAEEYFLFDSDMGLARSNDLFDCPIKTAKELFEQINESIVI